LSVGGGVVRRAHPPPTATPAAAPGRGEEGKGGREGGAGAIEGVVAAGASGVAVA